MPEPDHPTSSTEAESTGAPARVARGALGYSPGAYIGPYRLLEIIGEGGFGIVWLAERRDPMVQRVALKIIKPGMDSKGVIARFEQERQALAVMSHPGIARVFDGGVTENGLPYFVMEHVRGEAITTFCDRHRYTIRSRLELFIGVCEAVQHAHMKGIIHRDLKPSNVLCSIVDTSGDASGQSSAPLPVVKVIDFGVAKAMSQSLTENTIYTEQGQLIGTPEYMSPEQAEMGATDIDTRTDVYSLGVLLYELLSGTLPFDSKMLRSAGYAEIQRIIRETDPPRPSTKLSTVDDKTAAVIAVARQAERERIAGELRKELEWIPLTALRKDRARRYASAEAMASDVRRYLANRPLEAAPESRGYLLRKFLRRNRAQAAAAALIGATFLGGFASTVWQWRNARRNAIEADHAALQSRTQEARTRAGSMIDQRLFGPALAAAKEAYQLSGGTWMDSLLLDRVVRECQRSWELSSQLNVPTAPASMTFCTIAGRRCVVAALARDILIVDASNGALVHSITLQVAPLRINVLPAGDGALAIMGAKSFQAVSLKDWSQTAPTPYPDGARGVELAVGSSLAAVALSDASVCTFDAKGALQSRLTWPTQAKRRETQEVLSIAVSADDRFVLFGGRTFTSDRVLWDLGEQTYTLTSLSGNSFVFTGDRTVLAIGHEVNTTDISTFWYTLVPGATAAEPDLIQFAERSEDVRMNDTGHIQQMIANVDGAVLCGQLGVGVVAAPRVQRSAWRSTAPSSSDRYSSLLGIDRFDAKAFAIDPSGESFAVADDNRVRVFRRSSQLSTPFQSSGTNQALLRDDIIDCGVGDQGRPVLRVTRAGTVQSANLFPLWTIPPSTKGLTVFFAGLASSDDGTTIAVRHADVDIMQPYLVSPVGHAVTVVRRPAGSPWNQPFGDPLTIPLAEVFSTSGHRIVLSPDGERLLVSYQRQSGQPPILYDTRSGEEVAAFGARNGQAVIATAGSAEFFLESVEGGQVVNVRSWRDASIRATHQIAGGVVSLCVLPGAKEFAVGIGGKDIEIRDIASGAVVRTIRSQFRPFAWSIDGSVFVGCDGNPSVRRSGSAALVKAVDGGLIAVLSRGVERAELAQFTPDGQGFLAPSSSQGSERYELYRWTTPQIADQRLALNQSPQDRSAPDASDPSTAVSVLRQETPEPPPAAGAVRASDVEESLLDREVTVEGVVRKITPTRSPGNYNVFLGEPRSKMMVFIPRGAAQDIEAKFGTDLQTALAGRRISVHGKLTRFGGYVTELKSFLQIIISSPDQLRVLDDKPAEDGRPGGAR